MLWNSRKSFSPPVDIIQTNDFIVIIVELAGVKSEDFDIRLTNNRLIIQGIRHRPSLESQAYHRVEIGYGEFRLEVPISWSVQEDIVSAVYTDGFLRIDLPRVPEKQIQVMHLANKEQDENPDDQ